MRRRSLKRRVASTVDQDMLSARAIKRTKNAFNLSDREATAQDSRTLGNEEPRKYGLIFEKKLNRLQRCISAQSKPALSVTATVALTKRIKKAERQRGLLAALLDAPLDILYEVSLHLSPADLLCLSRVSNDLRNFYLSKSNRQIWVKSLASVDLPPCPEDLSEPQYASLIFDTSCIACDAPNIKSLRCTLRVRLCKECEELNVVNQNAIIHEFVTYELLGFIPVGFEKVKEAACEYVPSVAETIHKRFIWQSSVSQCYKPDLYDALADCLQQYSTKSEADFQFFCDEKVRLRDSIYEHGRKLRAWLDAREDARSEELIKLSERHEESVKSKLRDIGYTDEDWDNITGAYPYREDYMQWRKLVSQKRELTERTWKNLRPKLEELLIRCRKKYNRNTRLEEFTTAYSKYYREVQLTAGERYFLPELDEIRGLKNVQDFIFFDDAKRPITEDIWDGFIPTVHEICTTRKFLTLQNHGEALIKFRGEGAGVLRNFGPLQHILFASSFFSSSSFSPYSFGIRTIYYFNTVDSIGTYTPQTNDGIYDYYQVTFQRDLFKNFKIIDLNVPDALLLDLGFPLRTPMFLMQGFGERFVCYRCNGEPRKLMGWSALVMHFVVKQEREKFSRAYPFLVSSMSSNENHKLVGRNYAKILSDGQIAYALKTNAVVANHSSA